MSINIYNQLFNFIIFIIIGIIIGIIFDAFRVMRKTFQTSDFITYIEDILFWVLAGIILLFSIFKFNNGELRLYIFISIFIGISLYLITFSKYLININVKTLTFIKKIIYIPIKFIENLTKTIIFRPIILIIRKTNKKIKKNQQIS